ncbi:meiotic recombination protein REC8 homolog isoform X2 [Larimichthys crocea]|uniref:meiotic recombination protein REC8 homolog isoform X2 n=1 Tax=Larimichthys crocea TaxID=215358 RepID=UPI000F5F0168|nr:meiotic recombination protein REC8 homolog isoform X2 [Larimichthys crocea]
MEPVTIPVAEFEGVDLVDQHPEMIDFLMGQTDHFPEGEPEIPREEVTPGEEEMEMERGGREGDPERERTKEFTGSAIDLQPTILSSEDAVLLPGPPTEQLTPISTPVHTSPPSPPVAAPAAARERERLTLELEDVPSPEVRTRRRRKRQLIFFDPETQLSEGVLQQQINDPEIETRRLSLLPPSSHRMLPAAELLNNPCTFLPEEVQFLWRQAATVTPVSGSDLQVGERGPESTDSEKEREREMVEAAERELERLEFSPKEVPRDVAESEMFDISGHGSLPLEGSDQREVSREISPMYTSEREGSLVSRSVSALQDIPEVMDELPERETSELLPELAEHEDETSVLFQSLLPPEVDRRTVSNIFHRLLVALSAKKVIAKQDEPYGDIHIVPGQKYEEEAQEDLSSD